MSCIQEILKRGYLQQWGDSPRSASHAAGNVFKISRVPKNYVPGFMRQFVPTRVRDMYDPVSVRPKTQNSLVSLSRTVPRCKLPKFPATRVGRPRPAFALLHPSTIRLGKCSKCWESLAKLGPTQDWVWSEKQGRFLSDCESVPLARTSCYRKRDTCYQKPG